MKKLGISVAALAIMATSGTAMAAGESGKAMSTTKTVTSASSLPSLPALPPLQGGGWVGAQGVPDAYQPLARGATLPSFWMQPQYYIDDYARYGFAAPQDDFGWSRYYDDAVLTDGAGRVADVVKGVDWKKFDNGQFASGPGTSFDEGGFDRRRPDARDLDRDFDRYRDRKRGGVGRAIGSIGGALIGGAVGAVAGNLIAGKGERLAGSLIGGGVGALAGLAIGEATRSGKGRHHGDRHSGGHRYPPRGPHWSHGGWNGHHGHGGYETFTTVNYIPVAPITTTTTTTKVYYETITTGKSTYYPKRPPKRHPHQCRCHR